MHTSALRILAAALASALTLAAANPITNLTEHHLTDLGARQSCPSCDSPTGCPGQCAPLQGSGHSWCIGYCSDNTAVICDACGFSVTLGCIVNTDGSCFTSVVRCPKAGNKVSSTADSRAINSWYQVFLKLPATRPNQVVTTSAVYDCDTLK